MAEKDKITLRIDDKRKEALDKIIVERKKQDPDANLSDLLRGAIDIFINVNEDYSFLMHEVVRKAREMGVTPEELCGGMKIEYKMQKYKAQKAQEQKDYQG